MQVLIDKRDFRIYDLSAADGDNLKREDCFECDELIAPAIHILNLKGYYTTASSAGHPFPVISSTKSIFGPELVYPYCTAYIAFEEGCAPTVLPHKWCRSEDDPLVIQRYIGKPTNPFKFYEKRLKCMYELRCWARKLFANHF